MRSAYPVRTLASSRPPKRFAVHIRIAMIVVAVIALVVAPAVLSAPAASAVSVSGRGFGYYSAAGGGFWLGSWRLSDGTLAFCVNTERSTPNGQEFSYTDGATLGWYTEDVAARLAYISRTWAATTDRTTAAAGQIATWTITGLGHHTQEELAAKTGASAGAVLDLARKMLEETERSASRSASASLNVARDDDGTLRLTPILSIDTVASGVVPAPRGAHQGSVTLTGATFYGGQTSSTVRNGDSVPIHVASEEAVADVSASVRFDGIGYGNSLRMAVAQGGAQNLLTAGPGEGSADASLTTALPSGRPFQPVVSTQTSATVAVAGALIFDTVVVGVKPTPTTLTEWPVFGPPGGPFFPVPVTVRSLLLGPFVDEIVRADQWPANAPVVCKVSLVITTGPGAYRTPTCTLAGPGHYVWVESISASDTAEDHGRAQILPWNSPYGVETEVTTVEAPPVTPPTVDQPKQVSPPVAPTLPETGTSSASQWSVIALSLILIATGSACLTPGRSPVRRPFAKG